MYDKTLFLGRAHIRRSGEKGSDADRKDGHDPENSRLPIVAGAKRRTLVTELECAG